MGVWLNRSNTELRIAYKTLISSMKINGLQAPPASHYCGAFGFQSLLITTRPLVAQPNAELLEAVRAHEAFHGFQATAFQSTRELFRALQRISRQQLLTVFQMVKENIKIIPGQTIFEAGMNCSASILKNPFKALDVSISTLEKSLEPVAGITVFDLLEGSAAAVELLNRSRDFNSLSHFSLASSMDVLKGVYGNAWRMYRERGGESAAVFALLCATSLRYGSVSPPNFDNLPSPQEVFEYLARFARYFDSYVNGKEIQAPNYAREIPLGDFPDLDFNPRKADIPEQSWGDYSPSESDAHHFPDSMFDEDVESALDSYKKNRSQDQLRLQDNMYGVSMAIVGAVDAAYIRVGPAITEDQIAGEGRMIYDQVAHKVNNLLPGLQIEEVLLRAITQPDFQSRMAQVFESEVAKLEIAPWHESNMTVSHEELVSLYDMAQKIEMISIAEYADRIDDSDNFGLLMPNCCAQHDGDARTLSQLIACRNSDSVASVFEEKFGRSFHSIWSL